MIKLSVNEKNEVFCWPGPALLLFLLFRFEYLISGTKSYRDFGQTGPAGPGGRFSKVPIINGPGKLSLFTLKIEVSIVLHNMIKLSVNETKWSSLLARTLALILYISI